MSSETLVKASSLPTPKKRQKQENQQQHQFPPSFWDDLSRLWLTRRSLREFDRRTVWSPVPLQPDRSGEDGIPLVPLKRFARHGGPSLSDLRAYPEFKSAVRTMDSGQPETTDEKKRRNTSAYDPHFEDHLIRNGIYPDEYDGDRIQKRPRNLKVIIERLALPRASRSPSLKAFQAFKKKNRILKDEDRIMKHVIPCITGSPDIPNDGNLLFGNLKDLTDETEEKLCKAQPDFYDGLPRSKLNELNEEIRKQLGPYVVPSMNSGTPWLPNFFLEVKGPSGGVGVCRNQILYDGALGARAIHKLRSYVDSDTAFDNNAYTIVSSYIDGHLKLYTMHPTRHKPQKPIEYNLTVLVTFGLDGNLDTFRQGTCALKNARDLAKEFREELIVAVICKARRLENPGLDSSTHSLQSQPTNEAVGEEDSSVHSSLSQSTNEAVDEEDSSTHSSLSQSTDEANEEDSSTHSLQSQPTNEAVGEEDSSVHSSLSQSTNEAADEEDSSTHSSLSQSTDEADEEESETLGNEPSPNIVIRFARRTPVGSGTSSSPRTSSNQSPAGTPSSSDRSTRRTPVGSRTNLPPRTSPNQSPPGTVCGIRSFRAVNRK